MDTLASDIATLCPAAFSGVSGGLFLGAVTTLIAAHCSIADDEWPNDSTMEIMEKAKDGVWYDYIIIGSGTAGSSIAGQLSKIYPKRSILLVEAGDDPGVASEVPAFLFYNQNTANDWNYKTEPDGRSCLGFVDKSCIWSKGRVMGGSGSINAMIYIRGHPEDFAPWGEGWDYASLSPHFEKQERDQGISDYVSGNNDWYEILDEAWRELQFTKHTVNEALIGTKLATLLIKDGKRSNTAKIYLRNAYRNLHVMKKSVVEEITIDPEARRVSGVKMRYANGSLIDIYANSDVILSAGSIGTPHLLMLSGIGLKSHLDEIDIPCVLDLPVGQNLQDHLIIPLFMKTNIQTDLSPDSIQLHLLQYMLNRSGPLSNIGITDYMGFINTRNTSKQPDVQFHHMFYPKNAKGSLKTYLEGVGYRREIIDSVMDLNTQYDLLGIYPTLLHPKSKGAVMLKNKHPNYKPKIIPNYFNHPDDIKTLIDAIKFVHTLEDTKIFQALDINILDISLEGCSQYIFDSDSYWECYIRHMAMTIFHPVGTVKMGEDETSVVDKDLLVRGLENLRVADASIMPTMPSANIMAATLVVAQKAVDVIKRADFQKTEL